MEKKKYTHPEAFCLMRYQCKECFSEELIWNSRNGVTPFVIECGFCKREGIKSGAMQHIDWSGDKYLPDHFPKRGDRVFITMPKEILHLTLKARVEVLWELKKYPMKERYSTKQEAFRALLKYSQQEGQPYLLQL